LCLYRYDDGLARDVAYEIDVKLRTVRYTIRHTYDPPRRIGSEYLEGDFACFEGEFQGVSRPTLDTVNYFTQALRESSLKAGEITHKRV